MSCTRSPDGALGGTLATAVDIAFFGISDLVVAARGFTGTIDADA